MNLKILFGVKLSEAIASDNQMKAFACLKDSYYLLLENKNDIEVEKVTVDKKTLLYLNFLGQFRIFSYIGDYIECCRLLKAILGFKITRGVVNNMLYCLHEIDDKVVANDDYLMKWSTYGRITKKLFDQQMAYKKAMRYFKQGLARNDKLVSPSKEEQLAFIDYYMTLVKIDLVSSKKLGAFWEREFEDRFLPDPFAVGSKMIYPTQKTGKIEKMSLNEWTYIATWKYRSLIDTFFKVRRTGFKQNSNHDGYYYKELDLLYVYNGRHSATVGTVLGGEMEVEVVSIEEMYKQNIVTDGAYWYCFSVWNNDKRIGDIDDFRIAVLYELSRQKWLLENKGKMELWF